MNRWQKYFRELSYNGRHPRDKMGILQYTLLGRVEDTITVEFPIGKRSPSGTMTFRVVENDEECDMPNGVISVPTLASNLYLWYMKGLRMTTGRTEHELAE